MFGSISVSVIIPTYNGVQKVVQALDSLQTQSRMPDEIIVVIDGSTDNTKSIIESKNYKFAQFRIIEQENGGRAKVRNTGAANATSTLLLFMDDDMIAPTHWVEEHVEHHQKIENSILTGRLEDPFADNASDFLQFKRWLNNRWNKNFPDSKLEELQIDYPYISANNLSLPKSIFNKIGCFDERLTDAEDYDLAVRAMNFNIPLFLGFKTWAWHNDITNCKKYIHRLREYQKAQQRLIELKPDLYNKNHRYNVIIPKGLKKIVFKFFAKNIWVKLIDAEALKVLPKGIRYRIYDYVTTSKGVFNF